MNIYIGSDYRGYEKKKVLLGYLSGSDFGVIDIPMLTGELKKYVYGEDNN